jgi:carbamoyl-phosphate synthase large subunit
MGGQTALKCLEADEKEFGLILGKMIGVDVNAINITEDREQFKQLLKKINVPSAPAEICTSYLRGKRLHRNLVSVSDSSFVYIRRNGSGDCV